ncbi:ornithine cyclodeaminase family protein [Hoeflea prorocentri]|uniref:Ornithine cyclodeaminase family protein n=1 Tax=Hoeflea prorocentri TaxID=1922333 RepID=A0A9X3ZJC1_9HYPH|nr:ornithine cyclodeaminase family protein [Hoeflea prorocentri]MCY6382786.1 ornithine cyclodeaminase family protein [Hoeflea prorocentri]MDA5400586.1 ornithine cyclodeaminase family protein [Hoeflea prorocentri]
MRIISADEVDRLLDFPALIDALADAFCGGIEAPVRHHHTITRQQGADSTMLLMPAWNDFTQDDVSGNGFMGVKIVTVSPDNNAAGLPAVMGIYLLSDGTTGEPLAMIDGQKLTLWRTAAASALAARYLTVPSASRMVMIGAGKLAPYLIRAHATVRPIRHVSIWNRSPANAERVAEELADEPYDITVCEDRAEAIAEADIVSAATISTEPLVEGRWLKPGAHVDLVGAYSPDLRESDDDAVRRATLFVDTFGGALKEGGDLVQPMDAGVIKRTDIVAELSMLCRGDHKGRSNAEEITLFKSTGASLEDFAGGSLIWQRCQNG